MSHDPLPYAIYGDFLDLPLVVITYILFIFARSDIFISFSPISHPLSIWSGLYCNSIVMPHAGLIFFISTLCLSFTLHYIILLYTIYRRSYVHTCNLSLVLKATRASKELYLSSFVVSPSKECKQDRINHFLTTTSYSHIWLDIQHGGLCPSYCLLDCYNC